MSEHKELKAEWKNEVEVKTYKQSDVAKHNTKKDNWIIIHGKVYNVTDYSKDHPGGLDTLVEVAGTDATSAYEDVGHSEDAAEIMHKFLVGVIEGASTDGGPGGGSKTGSRSEAARSVVVRRHQGSQGKEAAAPSAQSRAELAAVAAGSAGLTVMVNSYILPFLNTHGFFPAVHIPHGAFTHGFLTATASLAVAAAAGATWLSRASKEKSFSSYAAHLSTADPSGPFQPKGCLKQSAYQQFRLRHKEELSDGIWRFVFDLPTKYSILGLPIGQHVAIKTTVDEHSVVRSYTPVSNNRDLGRLELLVRVYPQGLMGNCLKSLDIGQTASIRGPKGAMRYRRGMIKEIGMVGGGTGITPLFQLIRAICEDKKDSTRVSLVYGNRSETDIMLRDKLDAYARDCPDQFRLLYLLDAPSPSWTGGKGHVTKDVLKEYMPKPSPDSKVLLCGPPGMVNAMKKNLVELGFEAPGAVGKMTDQIFCF
ncbi:hypothetical protein H2204_005332 [Knufia peltigerae]|uniref:Cytochrome-b5 reductase n=1 Tax=Knufia peltigerae TaxID=1002370 RepID=A0AA38Y5S6_9EURO|nr:hypothetical protein H2204_005332 [Knufia peltigerae]